jgi:hypothetical protein
MGSVFATQPDRNIRGFAGKKYSVPFFLQFVPGYVVEVVHSEQNLRYNGQSSINTIIALPHYTDKVIKSRQTAGEKMRYYPLLRGIQDVPTKGDPVLLCTIGKINYYLGPLNTMNNSPTWNDDPLYTPEKVYRHNATGRGSRRGQKGESLNFNKNKSYKRLTKERKEDLDYGQVLNETTGDMLLEGRHGNSLRIGSRNNNPYLFISNNRSYLNDRESLADGSLISITSNGTLQQHFGGYEIPLASINENGRLVLDEENGRTVFQFTLSSDTLQSPNRNMGQTVSFVNNNQNVQDLIYGYDKNQMLFNSNRIILNSKTDDIYLSSIKDIHIGTGRHLTISTNENLLIESQKTFFGKNAKEPMVKGKELLDLLKKIIDMFSEVKSPPGFSGGPLIPSPNLAKVKSDIDKFLSSKYFIDE